MIDYSNPMDWAFVLLWVQLFGVKYMVQATDGLNWDMNPISAKGRAIVLAAGMSIIWIPYLAVWVIFGHSPIAIAGSVIPLWDMGIPIGYAAAIGVSLCLLSLPQSFVASFFIYRSYQKEQAAMRAANDWQSAWKQRPNTLAQRAHDWRMFDV